MNNNDGSFFLAFFNKANHSANYVQESVPNWSRNTKSVKEQHAITRRSIVPKDDWQHYYAHFFSVMVRHMITIETIWRPIMAGTTTLELCGLLAVGIVSTFAIIFFPLLALLNGLARKAPIKERLDLEPSISDSVDFNLDPDHDWIEQMQTWVDSRESNKHPFSRRYRCCSQRGADSKSFIRCFPIAWITYPWKLPCRNQMSRDIIIDKIAAS